MFKSVGVIGAGAMGSGIAQVIASAGYEVCLIDVNNDVLQRAKNNLSISLGKLLDKGKINAQELNAIFGRITFDNELKSLLDCELIIEAIIEDFEIKKSLIHQLNEITNEETILASNTSSLSITSLAKEYKNSDNFLGLHFFNPATLMQLVEIIPALQTSIDTVESGKNFIESLGKTFVLAKDTPGFIVNKVARPYYGEAIRIYEEGIADIATIDFAMTSLGGFKMGPFTLMDFIGHDVNYKVTSQVWTSFHYDSRYKPSFSQQRLVEAGYLGKKTNKGFYDYSISLPLAKTEENELTLEYIYMRILCMLINEAADTVFNNICTEDDVENAMLFGTNYPKGLLAWANELGIEEVIYRIDSMYDRYHEDRYRVSPYLRDRVSIL